MGHDVTPNYSAILRMTQLFTGKQKILQNKFLLLVNVLRTKVTSSQASHQGFCTRTVIFWALVSKHHLKSSL